MKADLDFVMATARQIRDEVERDRTRRVRAQLHAAAGGSAAEQRRPGGLESLSLLLPLALPDYEQLRASDRLEALERQVHALLQSAAPAAAATLRRPFARLFRQARRELRAIERETLTGVAS